MRKIQHILLMKEHTVQQTQKSRVMITNSYKFSLLVRLSNFIYKLQLLIKSNGDALQLETARFCFCVSLSGL